MVVAYFSYFPSTGLEKNKENQEKISGIAAILVKNRTNEPYSKYETEFGSTCVIKIPCLISLLIWTCKRSYSSDFGMVVNPYHVLHAGTMCNTCLYPTLFV